MTKFNRNKKALSQIKFNTGGPVGIKYMKAQTTGFGFCPRAVRHRKRCRGRRGI